MAPSRRCTGCCAPAAAATPADAALHALLRETDRQHREGIRGPAAHLAEIGALRKDLAVEVYEPLVKVCGWTGEEYRARLTATLSSALLEPGTS
ncbi:hypothetical protein [Dactylosporangium fulvum]|uniref:Uncharacterized protein n=1 Tax=Dactylosporangium fulvum TaxID=53359 RepID=A0ABY5VVJ5_9ACTN|nr:hypothetical protein [Dactylosporangium fulvum]UWP81767.1 hypothetical protein Dfulv_42835 [Dactylosporangium fulvum]